MSDVYGVVQHGLVDVHNRQNTFEIKKACVAKPETWCVRVLIFVSNHALKFTHAHVISKIVARLYPGPPLQREGRGRESKGKRGGNGMEKGRDTDPQLKFRSCASGVMASYCQTNLMKSR